ncbi:MAG: VWA domain-containing protein [Paracoccaceae bacterium]
MSWLSDISLLRPFWVLALPVIAALAVWSMRRRAVLGDWGAHIDPHLMDAMRAMGKVDVASKGRARQLHFWIAGGICLALTGPALERGNGQTFRNLDGVIFVVDVSGSMARDPIWPRALTSVRAGLSGLGTKPAALVVYAGDSYLASTLTLDHLQLSQTVALLDDETVPDRGSRPALALEQAADLLKTTQVLAGDVVLLSDGSGFGPETLKAASAIAQQGGRLSVVQALTTVSGEKPVAGEVFDALAQQGGGAVYSVDQLEELRDVLGESAEQRFAKQDFQLLFWRDYGRYLLLLALIPAAALFRRERR